MYATPEIPRFSHVTGAGEVSLLLSTEEAIPWMHRDIIRCTYRVFDVT